MIGDYTETQHADMLHRSRAGAMVDALILYQREMNNAVRASLIHGDDRSADDFRADARAALHRFPALLALVEPSSVPQPRRMSLRMAVEKQTEDLNAARGEENAPFGGWRNTAVEWVAEREGMNPYALDRIIREGESDDPEASVTALVERVGEWTGR